MISILFHTFEIIFWAGISWSRLESVSWVVLRKGKQPTHRNAQRISTPRQRIDIAHTRIYPVTRFPVLCKKSSHSSRVLWRYRTKNEVHTRIEFRTKKNILQQRYCHYTAIALFVPWLFTLESATMPRKQLSAVQVNGEGDVRMGNWRICKFAPNRFEIEDNWYTATSVWFRMIPYAFEGAGGLIYVPVSTHELLSLTLCLPACTCIDAR